MLMSDFGTKLLHPSSSQGVRASLLCRDVVWLTEEVWFRNKDVGFGGSVADVVHYSLSLLAPHLIIAAVPSRLVFCQSKEKQRTLISSMQQNCVAYQKSNFPFSEASVSITVHFLLLVHVFLLLGKILLLCNVLLLLPHFTSPSRPRLSHTPLFWKLLVVSDFACMHFLSLRKFCM